ncbi:phosphoenolpyruvate--protein phosphotransferase [Lentilactobacillus sp. Marseille-Q4993]|uniref:phosphoenolpyruvate--protein phosphotransferase n=1 Tax=Lentilactobacillus sp. Marseille-Q4993 TaxID=3039492 RepID=UPI0024BC1F42|nr:phosphoenolpyruvate--protein phosphotransferase [Lentilactobacillus sp. Marseille-Q4993]
MKTFKGISASEGIAIGAAFRLDEPDLSFKPRKIEDVKSEISRLDEAVQLSKAELFNIHQKTLEDLGKYQAEVFNAHIAILSDPEFFSKVKSQIRNNNDSAEVALKSVSDGYIDTFESLKDDYMRQRAEDVADVMKRIMGHLLGVELHDPALINKQVIIVAHDLKPSDAAQFVPKYVKGIAADLGGKTSHSAIMSRTLQIPTVVGLEDVLAVVENGTQVIIDGTKGQVIVDPNQDQVDEYQAKIKRNEVHQSELRGLINKKTASLDGREAVLAANISSDSDVAEAIENGAEGIGLFRTEFLYMQSLKLPSEDDQFEVYKDVLQKMDGKPVTIRTADIGGDKSLPYLKMPKQENPFLGYRAIRLSLDKDEIFRTQLRALIRASAYGDLSIMFPMISTTSEFDQAKLIYRTERKKLIDEGTKVGQVKLGIMVEVPSAALLADQFANKVDFMSIGTNDLIQYVMAADRGNEKISYLYQPYNPAVLRLIKNIIDSCHDKGIPACMCGEMAGDPVAIPLLVGLGLNEFSMNAGAILESRSLIRSLDSREMITLADRSVSFYGSSEEVKNDVTHTLSGDNPKTYK